MTFPIYGKIKALFQTTNQLWWIPNCYTFGLIDRPMDVFSPAGWVHNIDKPILWLHSWYWPLDPKAKRASTCLFPNWKPQNLQNSPPGLVISRALIPHELNRMGPVRMASEWFMFKWAVFTGLSVIPLCCLVTIDSYWFNHGYSYYSQDVW